MKCFPDFHRIPFFLNCEDLRFPRMKTFFPLFSTYEDLYSSDQSQGGLGQKNRCPNYLYLYINTRS